jgi:tetratricopeptide (TPR) repeat protein
MALQGDQSQRWQAEYWVAEASYRQGDFASAAKQFTRLDREARVKDEPFAKLLRLRRAQSLALTNDWERATDLVADLVRERNRLPQPEEVDLLRARILIHQKEPAQARELLSAITSKTSDSPVRAELTGSAWLLIGASWESEANLNAAATEYLRGYEKAELPEWQALCLLQAGKCLEELREMSRAREAYAIVLNEFADTASAAEARDRLTAAVTIAQGNASRSRVR